MSKGNGGLVLPLVTLAPILLIGVLIGGGMMGPGMRWGYGPRGVPSGTSGWTWGLATGLGTLSLPAFRGALIPGAVLLVCWFGGAEEGPALDDAVGRATRRTRSHGRRMRSSWEC